MNLTSQRSPMKLSALVETQLMRLALKKKAHNLQLSSPFALPVIVIVATNIIIIITNIIKKSTKLDSNKLKIK